MPTVKWKTRHPDWSTAPRGFVRIVMGHNVTQFCYRDFGEDTLEVFDCSRAHYFLSSDLHGLLKIVDPSGHESLQRWLTTYPGRLDWLHYWLTRNKSYRGNWAKKGSDRR
jgi:hypothetical protein